MSAEQGKIELRWTVSLATDPRTTREFIMLQFHLGPVTYAVALDAKSSETIAEQLHVAAQKCGHIVVEPTEMEKRLVKLAN